MGKEREKTSANALRLLKAGEVVIADKGFARATVEDIAASARVSTDVFYANFSGKGALLRALAERWVGQMTTVTNDATRSGIWETATRSEMVDLAARSAIDAIYDHAPIIRAVLAHGATDPALSAGLKKIGSLLTRRVMKVIKENKERTENESHIGEREVAFSLLIAISIAHHAVLVGADSTGQPFLRQEVTTEATRAIAAYLGAVPRSAGKLSSRRNMRAAARV
jgi:AcrR family transcriptional regulator